MPQLEHRPNRLQRSLFFIPKSALGSSLAARILHYFDGAVLRQSRGRYSVTSLFAGLPIVSVTTIGAKSGQPRSVPLVAIPDGENVILIASNFGQKHHPAWYYNLRAHPDVQLTYEGKTVTYVARETADEERERCWQRAVDLYSGYAAYKKRAEHRMIGVFLLTPQAK
jgi:deazaflavin-dependent oxidoreductase (nitroreductase family)